MKDLLRETAFGRIVRLVSGGRLFAYDEDLDPSTLDKFRPLDQDSNDSRERPIAIDQEKGADVNLVDWTTNDPQNPQNWSTPKKIFVTFEICLLTTSVYIGSAIYTAGLEGLVAEYHISPVRALLGLTLFVLGYALGPMIWVCPFSFPFGCSAHFREACLLTFYPPRLPCPKYHT